MNLITQEMLQNLKVNESISGIILISNYQTAKTKTGKDYFTGNLQSGITVPFKVWNNSAAFTKLRDEAYENVPSFISGTIDGFGGTNTIIIDSVQAVDGYTPDQFYPIRYNIDSYWDALKGQIAKRVSDKGFKLCSSILFNNEELSQRFKVEFAAQSHHDNCKGGLLAHTYKVISNMAHIITQYPHLVIRGNELDKDYVDLLYIGALLHDIGKTVEMNFGVYQPDSIVTHRYLGVEFIAPFKQEIVEAYNETWYYNLISILLQHHGQYAEPCKTLAARLVHEADMLDSNLTLLEQNLESVNCESGAKIKFDGNCLVV